MDSETLKLIQRLKSTSDGKDFINYLLDLSHINYASWKQEGGDILRGKAIAIDQLITLFETVDARVQEGEIVRNPEWM